MSAVLVILRGIATLLVNPALGGGSNLGVTRTAFLLNLFANIVESGEDTSDDLKALAAEIQAMVDANGGPTPAQWSALEARDKAARDALAANLAALDAPPAPQEAVAATAPVKRTSRRASAKKAATREPPNDAHQDPQV